MGTVGSCGAVLASLRVTARSLAFWPSLRFLPLFAVQSAGVGIAADGVKRTARTAVSGMVDTITGSPGGGSVANAGSDMLGTGATSTSMAGTGTNGAGSLILAAGLGRSAGTRPWVGETSKSASKTAGGTRGARCSSATRCSWSRLRVCSTRWAPRIGSQLSGMSASSTSRERRARTANQGAGQFGGAIKRLIRSLSWSSLCSFGCSMLFSIAIVLTTYVANASSDGTYD